MIVGSGRARAVAILLGMGLLSAACAPTGDAAGQELTVFAASSLRGPFTQLGDTFEQRHPQVTVRLNAAGSADLLAQLEQGAPADVFAPADLETMRRATAAGLVSEPVRRFASNTMTIAVPPGNPAGVRRFSDLAAPDVTVVVCAPVVPCGSATERIRQKSGVTLAPASEENSVADVLAKVSSSEADAGIVYVTDAQAAGGTVASIPIPARDNAVNVSSIAPTPEGGDLAREFVDLVTGAQGREVLSDAGFGTR